MTTLNIHYSDLNPSQRALLRSRERNVAMLGGFGSGKTTAGALKTLQLHACNPGVPGGLFAPHWATLWSTTYRALERLLSQVPVSQRPRVVDKSGACYLDFGDGAPIYLRSMKNTASFDGLDLGWFVLDEGRHCSKLAWQIALARARRKCPYPQRVVVTTPAYGYLSDEFNSGKPNRRVIYAPTVENQRHLDSEFVDDIKLSYSERMQRAYLEGKFTVLEGAVFELFDEADDSPWMVDFDRTPGTMLDSKVYLAIDPGYRKSAVIWILEESPREWVVFDELMLDMTVDVDLVEAISKKGWPVDEIWVDPAATAKQSYEGGSTLRALRTIPCRTKAPIRWLSGANREIPFGVDKLRSLLGGGSQPIRVRFNRKLKDRERRWERGIIKDLARLRFPEHKDGRPIDDRPEKDGVSDHSTDALRYWATGMCLTDPVLRNLDPQLRSKSGGFKVDREV